MAEILELTDTELIEILHIVNNLYGYDFTGYAAASMHRRMHRFMHASNLNDFNELKTALMSDRAAFERLLEQDLGKCTEMFRDPEFYACLRKDVFPDWLHLRSLEYGMPDVQQERRFFLWRYAV